MANQPIDLPIPWNRPIVEGLFWVQLALSIPTLGFSAAAWPYKEEDVFITVMLVPIALTSLINSSVHLFLIRRDRHVNLRAVVWVNATWALAWVVLVPTGVGLTSVLSSDEGPPRQWVNPVNALAMFFGFISCFISIATFAVMIRARGRQKQGYIVDSAGCATAPKKFGLRMQRYEPKDGHELGKISNSNSV